MKLFDHGSRDAALLTLVRLPLAVAFPFASRKPSVALAIVAAAGLSDVLDGWYARRTHQATEAGAILDPIVDKLFVGTVVLTLLLTERLSVGTVVLIGIRDLLELPLFAWSAFEPRLLSDRTGQVKANAFGKAATVVQFAAITAALIAPQHVAVLSVAAAIAGVIAAATYWSRVFRKTPADMA